MVNKMNKLKQIMSVSLMMFGLEQFAHANTLKYLTEQNPYMGAVEMAGESKQSKCKVTATFEKQLLNDFVGVECLSEKLIKVTNDEEVSGLYATNGKPILPVKYYITKTENDFYIVQGDPVNNKYAMHYYGVINADGKFVVPYIYSELTEVNEFFSAKVGDEQNGNARKYGLIDPKNQTIVPFEYDGFEALGTPFIKVQDKTLDYAVYNSNQKKFMTAFTYVDIKSFKQKRAVVAKKASVDGFKFIYGVIDDNGKEVVPLQYDHIFGFHNGLAAVSKNEKWGMINLQGKQVVPIKYEHASFEEDNYNQDSSTNFWMLKDGNKNYKLTQDLQLEKYSK